MRGAHAIVLVAALAGSAAVRGEVGIQPDHCFNWAENIGWMNWCDADGGAGAVLLHATFLSGFIWAENVGWINLGDGSPVDGVHYANADDTDFGVNVDPETGDLFGLAWGENIGWLNFDTALLGDERARWDACSRRFSGFVWGENVGWVNLDDAVRYVGAGPCALGDYDCDGVVSLADFGALALYFGGPDVAVDCPAFDSDGDGDVDLVDVADFQSAFDGGL